MSGETYLDELLSLWQRHHERGEELSATELCRDRPELIPEVERRLQALRQMQQMADTADGSATADLGRPDKRSADAAPQTIGGYEIIGELGRGGMGVVYKARQTALKRLVALKMILAGGHAGSEQRQRFRAEAEVVARLKHPNIVEIHDIGEADGLPYFALEFIEGGSLAQHLAGTPLPPGQAAALIETLARAMAHAHAHGVVHRDLKPANILLVSGGVVSGEWSRSPGVATPGLTTHRSPLTSHQPKITDFGLAKQLDTEAQTASGAVMGTPSYMAPEQAAGKVKELGPACDIYALGAILYECLTGRPPFKAVTLLETLQQVQTDEPVPPRRLQPKVPRDLETICLRCLGKEPARRYASAHALAEDLRRFQAGEPIAARPVRILERGWRWCRRKPAQAGMVTALTLLIVGLLGAAFWYVQDRAERASTLIVQEAQATQKRLVVEQGIRQALDNAAKPRQELHAILAKPGGVFGLLNEPARWIAYIQTARSTLAAAQDMLASADPGVDPTLATRAAELHKLLDYDEADRALAEKLEKIRMDRSMVRDEKFDDRGAEQRYAGTFAEAGLNATVDAPGAIAPRVAASPIREQLLAALDDWAYLAFVLSMASVPERLLEIGRLAAPDPAWGDRIRRIELWRDQAALAALAKEKAPTGLSAAQLALIGTLLSADHAAKVAWLRRAQLRYPSDFWLNLDLGNAVGKTDEGEAAGYYRVAVGVRPTSSAAYYNLGISLHHLRKLREATDAYQNAIRFGPHHATAHYNLGAAFYDQHRLSEAVAAYHEAIAVDPKFTRAYNNLGIVLRDQNRLPEAIAACKKAIALEPKWAQPYNSLGIALDASNQRSLAVEAFRQAIKLDPKYGDAYCNLGLALHKQGRLSAAVELYQQAIKLDPKDATAYNNLGDVLHDQNKLAESLAAIRRSIDLDPTSPKTYNNLGITLRSQKKWPEASAAFQKAIDLDPDYAIAYSNLGIALCNEKKLPEAIAALRKAIDLNPTFANAHAALGSALFLAGRISEAATVFEKTLKLLPPSHSFRATAATYLKQCRALEVVAKRVEAVLAGTDRATPAELVQMAWMCQENQKRYAAAVQLYRQAFKAQPALADAVDSPHRYNAACAATLATKDAMSSDQPALRRQARDWLRADLDGCARQVKAGSALSILQASERLAHWQTDADLSAIRDPMPLAALPAGEQAAWRTLWADVAGLLKQVRARIRETTLKGVLTDEQRRQVHEMKLEAGAMVAVDMKSTDLDSYLELHDPAGTLVAENDDITPQNLDARILFTPKQDGVYRITATSYQQRDRGAYTLTIRAVTAGK